jgi:DNA repair protein RadC
MASGSPAVAQGGRRYTFHRSMRRFHILLPPFDICAPQPETMGSRHRALRLFGEYANPARAARNMPARHVLLGVPALRVRDGASSRGACHSPAHPDADEKFVMGLVRDRYGRCIGSIHERGEDAILQAAESILRRRFERLATLGNPSDCAAFLRMRLAGLPHEEFHAVWLDQRHRVIAVERLFNGTLGSSAVHARELVRAALAHNAGAVILAHNHPSGVAEPSAADRDITDQIKRAMQVIGVRVLDHFVIGSNAPVSFAERGWI